MIKKLLIVADIYIVFLLCFNLESVLFLSKYMSTKGKYICVTGSFNSIMQMSLSISLVPTTKPGVQSASK